MTMPYGLMDTSHLSTVAVTLALARITALAKAGALDRLAETTRASGTDWALGTEARSRALLGSNQAAEDLYREAIGRLGRAALRIELARA